MLARLCCPALLLGVTHRRLTANAAVVWLYESTASALCGAEPLPQEYRGCAAAGAGEHEVKEAEGALETERRQRQQHQQQQQQQDACQRRGG